MYKSFFKGIIDFIIALIAMITLSPIFIIVWILLLYLNNGKPLFYQKRPGKNERIFSIIKFRSMNNKKDKNGNLLADSERLTKVGHFIREFSIDEIPQLINVLKFDMSLIGPRPLRVRYLEFYNDEQKRRHHVKPGITGWAQINGRNNISWKEKFKYDVWYVDKVSFLLDVKILFLTVLKVIKSEGVSVSNNVNTGKFNGTN